MFAVVVAVIAIDLSRTAVSLHAARRYSSAALLSNALHFGSDLAGTLAVLCGLTAAALGWPQGDSVAALFVAVLVVIAAARLIRRNIDVLMDRAPADAVETARRAIRVHVPGVRLQRLRLRQAAGRHFVDVVIGVSPGAAVAQGHAAADDVEEAVRRALPEADVVVHVEPEAAGEAEIRERAQEAALQVPRRARDTQRQRPDDRRAHRDLAPPEAAGRSDTRRGARSRGERRAVDSRRRPRGGDRPDASRASGRGCRKGGGRANGEVDEHAEAVLRIVNEETGGPPRGLRMLETGDGLVVFLTLALDPHTELVEAHRTASAVEERIRRERPAVADVHVHTEP